MIAIMKDVLRMMISMIWIWCCIGLYRIFFGWIGG